MGWVGGWVSFFGLDGWGRWVGGRQDLLEEGAGGTDGQEGPEHEDLVWVVDVHVDHVDFQGHVGVVHGVFGVVEVELFFCFFWYRKVGGWVAGWRR